MLQKIIKFINRFIHSKPTFSGVTIMGNFRADGKTFIGKYTYIGYNCAISRAEIGRYCSIADNITIGAGEHTLDKISTNSLFYENAKQTLLAKDCIIGNDVWIGVDSIIRRGITIGNGAVIGANSFVNSNIPPYAVAVGSPAKVIKFRFTDEQIKMIEETSWWKKDIDEAKITIKELKTKIG